MSALEDKLCLPPGLEGETKYVLYLTIDEILWSEENSSSSKVYVEWWGQHGQGITFTPVDVKSFQRSKIGDVHVKSYHVKTSLPKLKDYLKDASPLKINVRNSEDQPLGFSLIQNVERVVDLDGLDGYYPVFNSGKETIANLRVHIKVEAPPTHTATPNQVVQQSKPKITLKSRKPTGVTGGGGGKTPPVKGSPAKRPMPQKVTFSDAKLEAAGGGGSSIADRQPLISDGRRTPLADTLVTELLNQSQQLRKNMRRQIETNFAEQRFSDLSDDESVHTIEYSRPPDEPRLAPISAELPPSSSFGVSKSNAVPSWNLPVQRMKYLARVTRLVVHVSSVQVNLEVLDRILRAGNPSDKKVLPSRRRNKENSHVSFFLKYKLPGGGDGAAETSFCSRKLKQSFVDFNARKLHPTVFNAQLLEDWWSYTLDLRVFSRHLNQRTPLSIGEASVGLKHLLLHEKYSCGEPLMLPLYASGSLNRDLKLPQDSSEIIGNVHLSFKFEFSMPVSSGARLLTAVAEKPAWKGPLIVDNKPEQQENDNEAAVLAEALPSTTTRPPSSSVLNSPRSPVRERRTINSRPERDAAVAAGFNEAVLLQLSVRGTVSDAAERWTVKHRDLEGEVQEAEVGGGEEMVVTNSLFLSGPQGKLHNRLMLSRLNQNYLILEVWSGDKLQGVAKIPTEPLHTAFKPGRSLDRNFFDGRVDVVDLIEDQIVGELLVSLSAGSAQFILGESATLPNTQEEKKHLHVSVQTSFIVNGEKTGERSDASEDEEVALQDIREPPEDGSEAVGNNNNHDKSVLNADVVDVNANNAVDGCLVEICIEEARNLPNVKSKGERVAPRCYVTLLEHKGDLSTQVELGSSPVWNYKVETRINAEYIINPRKYVILKVWHSRGGDTKEAVRPDPETDQVLGFVALDLSPLLLASFPSVQGWYNITDWMGKCRGQIKISVTPLERVDKSQFSEPDDPDDTMQPLEGRCGQERDGVEYLTCGRYSSFPGHLVNHVEEIIQATREGAESVCSLATEPSSVFWQGPRLPTVTTFNTDNPNLSALERSLNRHLSDLGNIARNLIDNTEDANSDDGSHRTFVIQNRKEVKAQENSLPAGGEAGKGIGILGNLSGASSSRTSLQTSSIEELPRDDLPNLADLGLVLEDLGMYLGDTETEHSRRTTDHFFPPVNFQPDT